jgi:hypothetical protein
MRGRGWEKEIGMLVRSKRRHWVVDADVPVWFALHRTREVCLEHRLQRGLLD